MPLKNERSAAGERLAAETEPVRDCSGNALPDGTIVTFTETYNGGESTVDVPLQAWDRTGRYASPQRSKSLRRDRSFHRK